MTIGYDVENLLDAQRKKAYKGEITTDHYGRKVPKHAHGTVNLKGGTSSTKEIMEAVLGLYDRIVNQDLLVRRITITANHVVAETLVKEKNAYEQLDLFTDYAALQNQRQKEEEEKEKERNIQKALLSIKKRYGKNAILKGTNFCEGATAMDRNRQIGGHKA